jgi:GT2 family glycosyltransferase
VSFTIVVATHQSERDLGRLLPSLALLSQPPQVVVVDSGSTDATADVARRYGAETVELAGNPGFGAANNAGLALARHETTVLLNPDTVVLDDGLSALAALPVARDALYAPRLLNEDRTVQRSVHPLPGSWTALLPALVHPRLLPTAARLDADPWRADEPREVGWAIAACVAARTETLRRLGPFDASVFLFGEDMDLCLRACAIGVPTVYWPAVTLVHTGGTATRAQFGAEPRELKARRRREVVRERLGAGALARDDAAQALTFVTRTAARRVARRDPSAPRADLAALRAARRG